LVYAYLQKGDVDKAKEQIEYLNSINEVYPQDFKDAYSFASIPTRYSLENKNWNEATHLKFSPDDFPWEKFPWEKANINFGRLLGAVHTNNLTGAKIELKQLQIIHEKLKESKEDYKANLLLIQIKASEGWIKLYEGHKAEALTLMNDAADMEDSTEKHPVTPAEVLPARELLGDMYLEIGEPLKALEAYKADLKRHPNRFNGVYGAGLAAEKSGNIREAIHYYSQLISTASTSSRPEISRIQYFLKNHI
jgi:tetratricopeptide (TPR) repeat protein